MPTYDYTCFGCNKSTERRMTFEQHENTKDSQYCDECGAIMKQKVSAPSFNLVGSGWYRDGFSGSVNTQAELDKELKIYDKHRDKQAQNKYDRELTNV
jgi:putative FmdB family regulatory protein